MKWYIKVLSQYADFGGRARRKEFWMFVLFNFIAAIVAMVIDTVAGWRPAAGSSGLPGYGPCYLAYAVAALLPALAVTVRRLHDLGKSGWWVLISLIPLVGGIWLLVLMLAEGQTGDNKYGADPKTCNEPFGEPLRLKSAGITLTVSTVIFILLYIFNFVLQQIEYSSHGIPFDIGSMLMFYIPNLTSDILFLCVGILLVSAKSIREVTEKRKTVPVLLLVAMSIGFILTVCSIFKMIPNIQDADISEMYGQQIVFNFIYSVFSIFFQLSVLWFAVSLWMKKHVRIAITSMAVFAVLRLLFAVYSTKINMPVGNPDRALQWMLSNFYILAPVNFLVLAVAFYPRKENVGDTNFDERSSIKNSGSSNQIQPEHGKKPVLRSFGKETRGQYTYEYYAASSAEEARLFLSFCSVTEANYYIQVETPEGIWGLDKEGLYLTELLPFQKNLSLAQCEGVYGSFSMFNTMMAAKGVADNFVSDITCGNCGHKWHDGVRYNDKTVVKCPACKKYNSVDTTNFKVNFIG